MHDKNKMKEHLIKELQNQRKEFNKIKANLNEHIEFQKLVTNISTRFISINPKLLDKEINRALQEIGEYADVDRSYVFLFENDITIMNNTHEWCAEGIEPQIDNLKELSTDIFPWWMKKLQRFENVYIPDVANLPKEAEAEKEILQSQDILSLIVVPLIYGNTLIGFLGFDSVKNKKEWSEDIIALLRIVGDIFAGSIEHNLMNAVLLRSEERYRTMIENANDLIWSLDVKGKFTYANSQAEQVSGFTFRKWKGKSFTSLVHLEDQKKANKDFQKVLSGKSSHYFVRIYDKNRNIIYLSINSAPIIQNGVVVEVLSFGRDITRQKAIENELKKTNKKLQMLARTDFLTKLPNRRSMLEKVEYEINKFERSREPFIIMIGDLDNFKFINDEYGHIAGDKILKLVSRTMLSGIRKQDVVARWGGDEFLFLLPQTNLKGGRVISRKLEEEIAKTSINFQKKKISIDITFGLSVYNKPMDIDNCITIADGDLYENKRIKGYK